MASRSSRREIARDTLATLERGTYTNQHGQEVNIKQLQQQALSGTEVFSPEAGDALLRQKSEPRFAEPAQIEVNSLTTFDAVRELVTTGESDVLCLNFASAKNPGGGFLGGSQAQEESLARSSGLYPCLLQGSEYYETNRNTRSCIYTDYMIYSPRVPILKDEEGHYLDEAVPTSIITAPAVNTGVVKRQEEHRLPEVESVMKRRISKVLSISRKYEHTVLVLGAWGCGVFQNDPTDMARYFHEVIEADYRYDFKRIVFAVYARDPRFREPFEQEFSN